MGVTAAERDRKLGGRVRRGWNKIKAEAESYGLTEAQVRDAVESGALTGTDAQRRALAKKLGLTPEEWAELFETLLPIILQMMAMCA